MALLYDIQYSYRVEKKTGFMDHYSPHFHNGCEIYVFLEGEGEYFVEKTVYPLKSYDVFITREDEVHTPIIRNKNNYERFYIQFDPKIIRSLNLQEYDLLKCFYERQKGQCNKLQLNGYQLTELREFMRKIYEVEKGEVEGKHVLRHAYFLEFLVFINTIHKSSSNLVNVSNLPEKLSNILDFIEENIREELSLELLEEKFFLNKHYICRLFKKSTGMNLHDYITFKRISFAKQYLKSGYSVTDSAFKSGFRDYSNFIRVFKKYVGISPGKFSRMQE